MQIMLLTTLVSIGDDSRSFAQPGHIEHHPRNHCMHECHMVRMYGKLHHVQLSWPGHIEDPFTCTIVMAWTHWRSLYMHNCHGLDILKIPLHAQLSWPRHIEDPCTCTIVITCVYWISLGAEVSWPGHTEHAEDPYMHNCHGLDTLNIPTYTIVMAWTYWGSLYIHNCHGLDILNIHTYIIVMA